MTQTITIGTRMELLKGDVFRDDDDNEITVPAGAMGTVAAVDPRESVTIYEVHMDNGTFLLYSPEQDGPGYMKPLTQTVLPSIYLRASEQMASRARDCQTTVAELFAAACDVSFDMPGHADGEAVQHTLNITPELISKAEAILSDWNEWNA